VSDEWGIQPGYGDTLGQWHTTTDEARQALVRAMGDPPANAAELRVVRQSDRADMGAPGELRLEDGTALAIDRQLPPDVPLGYHTFHGRDMERAVRVIVSPGVCWPAPERTWGWGAQLYAVRSPESWGIGDLADLRRLAQWAKGLGAGCLLVNPLNAVAPVLSQQASPYSPTSRRFRNPLYLRIEQMPGAATLGAELESLAAVGRALNANPRIDRDALFRLKQQAFEKLWERFPGDPAFDRFRAEHGAALEQFAIYSTLAERYGADWRAWPAEYRHPDRAKTSFAAGAERRIAFHAWLQWQLDVQLAAASSELAMVQDLPIGFDPGGADAWAWQDLLAQGVSVGAPPDAYNMLGQDWGLPPLVPRKLRAAGYAPIIETIRAALRHAGGLRIDHVLGFFRLFWIPHGTGAKGGAYVEYRADEMLAILALESQRVGAFVVGEDLGTIDHTMRSRLAEHRVLSCRVVWFEQEPPERYSQLAMASVTTHDLPTIAGAWTGSDARGQREARLAVAADTEAQMHGRLMHVAGVPSDAPVEQVIEQTYAALARAPSAIVLAMLEDALAVEHRMNMPGTVDQWPNWSVALPGGIEALEASPLARKIAEKLTARHS
jgi:4-alpha-glucanotransferase